jgi:hypothetical protein
MSPEDKLANEQICELKHHPILERLNDHESRIRIIERILAIGGGAYLMIRTLLDYLPHGVK